MCVCYYYFLVAMLGLCCCAGLSLAAASEGCPPGEGLGFSWGCLLFLRRAGLSSCCAGAWACGISPGVKPVSPALAADS